MPGSKENSREAERGLPPKPGGQALSKRRWLKGMQELGIERPPERCGSGSG